MDDSTQNEFNQTPSQNENMSSESNTKKDDFDDDIPF